MQAFGEVFDLTNSPASFNYFYTGNGNEIQGDFSGPDLKSCSSTTLYNSI